MKILTCSNFKSELLNINIENSEKLENFDSCNCLEKTGLNIDRRKCTPENTIIIGGICLKKLSMQKEYLDYYFYLNENCFYQILNKSLIDQYVLSGNYLVSRGWLINWRRHIKQMGFIREDAVDFWAQFPGKLLFLNTIQTENFPEIQEFSNFIDKDYTEVFVGLDNYEKTIRQIYFEQQYAQEAVSVKHQKKELRKDLANYQLSFDIIPELIKSESSDTVLREILHLVLILSGCQNAIFMPEKHDVCKTPIGISESCSIDEINREINNFKQSGLKWDYLNNRRGFIYCFTYHREVLGFIISQDVQFPEYIPEYADLFVKISSLCSFLIMNVKVFEEIKTKERQLKITNLELVKANEAVKKANELKDLFIAKISHEMRNPLAGIIGLSSELNRILTEDKLKKMTVFIEEAGNRLLYIIEDLLNYFNYSKGEINFSFSEFNFEDIISSVLQSNNTLLQNENIRILANITPSDYKCYNDKNRIQQIIDNLVTNAIKYSKSEIIDITIFISGSIQIIVTDYGVGIPEDQRDNIFKPFFRLNKEKKGSGLGLAIVKELVGALGGAITLESSPGQGCRFIVILDQIQKKGD